MSTIFWGFYLHIQGVKIGSSASVGVGSGSFGVEGPSYNWGSAGQGGCYFACNYKGLKIIYSVNLDFVSIQGQGFVRPAMEQKDEIGEIPLNQFMNSRLTVEVHKFSHGSKQWVDVPLNLKLTVPHGSSSGKKEQVILERNQLVSLKGIVETPAILRGRLFQPSFNPSLWDACFGRN